MKVVKKLVPIALAMLATTSALAGQMEGSASFQKGLVATGTGIEINYEDLDKLGGEQLYTLKQELFKQRTILLQKYLVDQIYEKEASKAGMTTNQYIEQEINAKAAPVQDTEIEAFINANKDRFDSSIKNLQPKVKSYLTRQSQKKREADYFMEMAPRYNIKVALISPERSPIERVDQETNAARTWGNSEAPVTIVEYSDFGCSFCKKATSIVNALKEYYPNDIKVSYKYLPFRDMEGARAAECAAEQNQFWGMHDRLFESYGQDRSQQMLVNFSKELGMDQKVFHDCMSRAEHANIQQDHTEAMNLHLTGTPVFFINGRKVVGAQPVSAFREIIDEELYEARKVAANP